MALDPIITGSLITAGAGLAGGLLGGGDRRDRSQFDLRVA